MYMRLELSSRSDLVNVERINTLRRIPDFSADPFAAMEKVLLNVKKTADVKEARKYNGCFMNPSR